jgi:hypothetical protein
MILSRILPIMKLAISLSFASRRRIVAGENNLPKAAQRILCIWCGILPKVILRIPNKPAELLKLLAILAMQLVVFSITSPPEFIDLFSYGSIKPVHEVQVYIVDSEFTWVDAHNRSCPLSEKPLSGSITFTIFLMQGLNLVDVLASS